MARAALVMRARTWVPGGGGGLVVSREQGRSGAMSGLSGLRLLRTRTVAVCEMRAAEKMGERCAGAERDGLASEVRA